MIGIPLYVEFELKGTRKIFAVMLVGRTKVKVRQRKESDLLIRS